MLSIYLCVTVQLIPALSCSEEESDTRIVLHTNHATNTRASHINVVNSPDNDVLVTFAQVHIGSLHKLYGRQSQEIKGATSA